MTVIMVMMTTTFRISISAPRAAVPKPYIALQRTQDDGVFITLSDSSLRQAILVNNGKSREDLAAISQ
jgi:hypothetical protein